MGILKRGLRAVRALERSAWAATIQHAADRGIEVMQLPPREVFLEVTAHCNIKCPMCPVTTGLDRARGTMKYELFEKILQDVAGIVPHMSLFLAGEPLLHKRIFDMIGAASGRGIFTRIHTNALLLDERKIEAVFDSGLDELSFSFDGPTKERYDRVRVAGDYDKCIRIIKRVMQVKRQRGSLKPFTRIQIIYFQGEDPVAQRREMETIFQENLPDELSVVPAHSWAGEYQEFVRYRDNVGDPSKLSICHMPWDRMAITWDGNVVACCNDFLAKYLNGNVCEQSVLEVWNSEAYQALRRRVSRKEYEELEVCRGCDVPWAGDKPRPLWSREARRVLAQGLMVWRKISGGMVPAPSPHADITKGEGG
jgi:radical SAM protein with 4Fe4S-binding SPASM domain